MPLWREQYAPDQMTQYSDYSDAILRNQGRQLNEAVTGGHNPYTIYRPPDHVVASPWQGQYKSGAYQDVPQQQTQQPSSGGYYGGGFGYSAPTHQPPALPQLPSSLPSTPISSLNLPETPNFYEGISAHIPDAYAHIQPFSEEANRLNQAADQLKNHLLGKSQMSAEELAALGITGTPDVKDLVRITQQAQTAQSQASYLGDTDFWGGAQEALDRHVEGRVDHYGHLDPSLTDHYSGLDFFVPDYYAGITPVTYEHYLGLDPTLPDYYTRLQEMIESGGFIPEYEALSDEELLRLAKEYADLQIDPVKAQLQRYLEQAALDAAAQEERIRAAYAPGEAALERREEAQAKRDLESAIARGGGRAGAVEWASAERQMHHAELLTGHKGKEAAELTAIANQLGLTERQIQERKVELEEMRGKLTSQELKDLREREWDKMFHAGTWKFEASMMIADRLTAKHQWEFEQARYIADRMTQIDMFNKEMEMSIADRRTALDQWMKEMEMGRADRLTALEQWEKQYDLEVAHAKALDDDRFRTWEVNMRMGIGDRQYDRALQEFNLRLGLADRTYQQAADQFARELQIADRLTQQDIDQMARALDIYDRTQMTPYQQFQLWIMMSEVFGVAPAKLPGT